MTAVVSGRGLTRQFGQAAAATIALDHVDFDLPSGTVVGITGPSGCGKSTLLNLVGLLDAPTAGNLTICGHAIAPGRLTPAAAALRRSHVGFLFQDAGLIANMTALDNIMVPLRYLGHSAQTARRLAEDALDRFGLGYLAGRSSHLLSGGERQRVALVRALVKAPSILICDEPTASLDEANTRFVIDALADAAAAGALVLCSTHDPLVIAQLTMHLSMLRGRIDAHA